MKLLFFTDTHIRNKNFENRKDDYLQTVHRKLNEIREIGEREQVDCYLHGGDVFDRPDISLKTASEFARLFRRYKKPIYVISGNHDIYGHNPESIDRSMLGLYDALGVMHLIEQDKPVILTEGDMRIQISAAPYRYDIDQDEKSSYFPKRQDHISHHILMVHSILLEKPFISTVAHTLIDEISDTDADIVLAGHYHTGFGIVVRKDKYFVNPGALVRISRTTPEYDRVVGCVVIELTENDKKVRFVPLQCQQKGADVLREKDTRQEQRRRAQEEFLRVLRAESNLEHYEIKDIFREITANQNIDKEVIEEAMRRLGV